MIGVYLTEGGCFGSAALLPSSIYMSTRLLGSSGVEKRNPGHSFRSIGRAASVKIEDRRCCGTWRV
jgi:hypothetical protein